MRENTSLLLRWEGCKGAGGGGAGGELRFTDDIIYYGRITSYGCFTELTIQSSVT